LSNQELEAVKGDFSCSHRKLFVWCVVTAAVRKNMQWQLQNHCQRQSYFWLKDVSQDSWKDAMF